MTRILALVALLFAGDAWAQEPIVLEKIGAVRMALPDELQRHDSRAECPLGPMPHPLTVLPRCPARQKAQRAAQEERPAGTDLP